MQTQRIFEGAKSRSKRITSELNPTHTFFYHASAWHQRRNPLSDNQSLVIKTRETTCGITTSSLELLSVQQTTIVTNQLKTALGREINDARQRNTTAVLSVWAESLQGMLINWGLLENRWWSPQKIGTRVFVAVFQLLNNMPR